MISATGQTFQHRETLKGLRGKWNTAGNCWQFEHLSASQIATLRGLVGVQVVEDQPQRPKPAPARPLRTSSEPFDLAALVAAFVASEEAGETDAGYKTVVYGDNQQFLNHFKDKNPAAFFGFSSLAAHAAYIDRLPNHKRRGSGWDDMGEWSGSDGMTQALRLARDGWAEGIEQAAEILQILNVEHASQRKRAYSIAGGQVNVGKMLAGNPMHMIKRPKQPGRKIVTLFVETSMSAAIRAETIKTRAVIIAALAEILEREGYSCEIVATDISTTGTRVFYQLATTLKAAGERLNLFDAIFGLGHPSFLRRFSFAALSSSDECWIAGGHGQGSPSVMFNDKFPTARNEFYIRPLTSEQQKQLPNGSLREIVVAMLPFIEPANLPIKIRNTE
jgi:hypothetical protein